MAVTFRDGMDSYGSTADAAKKWAQVTSPWAYNATAGRNGGGALQCVNGSAASLITPFGSATNGTVTFEICLGFWLKVSAIPAATSSILVPLTSANQQPGSSVFNIQLSVTTGNPRVLMNGTTYIGSTNICDNTWHWIEVDQEYSNAANSTTQICYVDTIQQWSVSNANPASFITDHMMFVGVTTITLTLDDVIMYDNVAGGPVLSSFPLGPRQISTFRPNGDVTQTFSRSTGSSNYTLVDEQTPDTADYVESGTSGDQDLYDFETFSVAPAGITDVGWNAVLQNPNPGTINYQSVLKSGGSTSLGTSTIAPTSYTTKQVSYGVDPATSAAWTSSGINSVQAGIKVA